MSQAEFQNVIEFLKKYGYTNPRAIRFAIAYICANARKMLGADSNGKEREKQAADSLTQFVEKHDQVIPVLNAWIDLPWVNSIEEQVIRYAVRTGYELLVSFERRYGELPDDLEGAYIKFISS